MGTFAAINQDNQTLETLAFFVHSQIALSDQWSMSAGLRWSRDEKEANQGVNNCVPITGPLEDVPYDNRLETGNIGFCPALLLGGPGGSAFENVHFNQEQGWEDWSGEIGFEYKPIDELLVYAKYSRGFKSGGFGGTVLDGDSFTAADSENVNAYEIGFKSDWFDNTLRANFAMYYYDYRNFQVTNTVPNAAGFPAELLVNVPRARLFGGELELTYQPVEELIARLGLGWSDSEFRSNPRGTIAGFEIKGNRFRQQAPWNINGSISYTFVTDIALVTTGS